MTSRPALADEVDTTERLSPDDMATLREGQFLDAALAVQRDASAADVAAPGTCRFCKQPCLPLAVYCDADCRADDERQAQIMRRQGRR